MSPVSSKDVMALRQKTGIGMMDCKRALEAADGDFEKAIEYLRKKGIAKGEARLGRRMGEGLIDSYIHPGGRIGVLLEVTCETDFVARSEDFRTMVHDIAMHIAAAVPKYVQREDIPEEKVQKELEIYREQIADANKPPEIVDRIAKGKLEKFYREVCLLEQGFVKDPDKTIKELILETAGKLKENIMVRRFTRFALGD